MRALVNLALFALPFLFYIGWLHLKEQNPWLKQHWDRQPVIWIGLCGVLLAGGYFLYHLAGQSRDPTAVYVPARVENGVFHPAHLAPRAPEPRR
ncbi:DUF6111 family protein [Phreatobacter stygius]|uniref:Uncharacterized protein n=1 Tax=Phreatobacter stygius TaxID=1940610 RepID=A0A4D7AUV6_9HYPH|nr:DUF6111 family protein [Phreatobacter stygius]QCI63481.1 hypothetical protein E8M01_04050 [Phreatobacter stygius]